MDIFGNSEDGSGITSPETSTTNALVRYANTTGKLLKNSTVTLSDAGDLTGLKSITPSTGWPVLLYGDLDMGQNLIIDLATPVNDFDAVTKEYVDGKAGNQTATTGLTTFTGTIEAGIVKKTGGTSIQYMMADGSALSQSASSGNSNFYLYKSHTNTPTPPPTSGFVYYNNAIQKNATIIYISHLTEDNTDIEIFFQNLSTLNEVYIQQKILSDNFIKYNITGIPTVVTGSHISIPVAQVSFGGTGEISFGTNEPILVSFFTNNLEVDTRLSNLETKTQNQTAISGTTTITGTVITSVVQLNNITTSGVQISVDANLDMSQNSINDLATPANDYDAANKLYVDEKAGNQTATTGLTTFTGDISISGVVDMNGYALANVATPLISTDGANKSYVDSAKLFIDLTPTTTTPTLVEGRVYYDNGAKTLVYAKNNNWYAITSSLFVPSNFSRVNLRAWYDASNSSSLSQISGTVTLWNDISGNGNDLNTVTNNPLTGTSTINGRNVVVFDGNDNIYRTGNFIDYFRHTIVIVSTATVIQNDMYGSGSIVTGDVLFNINAAGTYRAHAFRSGDSIRDSTFTLNTGMSIRIQRVGATTLDIIEDGNNKKNSFSFGGSLSTNPKGIFLGWRNTNPTQGFRGSMGEVLVYDTDITNNDLNVLGNYLGAKWGITWTNLT